MSSRRVDRYRLRVGPYSSDNNDVLAYVCQAAVLGNVLLATLQKTFEDGCKPPGATHLRIAV